MSGTIFLRGWNSRKLFLFRFHGTRAPSRRRPRSSPAELRVEDGPKDGQGGTTNASRSRSTSPTSRASWNARRGDGDHRRKCAARLITTIFRFAGRASAGASARRCHWTPKSLPNTRSHPRSPSCLNRAATWSLVAFYLRDASARWRDGVGTPHINWSHIVWPHIGHGGVRNDTCLCIVRGRRRADISPEHADRGAARLPAGSGGGAAAAGVPPPARVLPHHRAARHHRHPDLGTLSLSRPGQQPGDALRHRRRPRRLPVVGAPQGRTQGGMAGLAAAGGDDRAPALSAALHGRRARAIRWARARSISARRCTASTAPTSRRPSASRCRRAASASSIRTSSTCSTGFPSAPRWWCARPLKCSETAHDRFPLPHHAAPSRRRPCADDRAARRRRSATAQTLDAIKQRGSLVCGVSEGIAGFSAPNGDKWTGFDVDLCRALAAAVLGDADKVRYVPLNANDRFAALQSGTIDVLSRNSTWTMSRETDLKLVFPAVTYYDGQGFMIRRSRPATSALELDNTKVCVQSGTTTELNLVDFFRTNHMKLETRRAPEREGRGERLRCRALRRVHQRRLAAPRRAALAREARRSRHPARHHLQGAARPRGAPGRRPMGQHRQMDGVRDDQCRGARRRVGDDRPGAVVRPSRRSSGWSAPRATSANRWA